MCHHARTPRRLPVRRERRPPRLSRNGRKRPPRPANRRRISRRRISVLAENESQLQQWRGSKVGIFLDLNSGMNRTGIEQNHSGQVGALVRAIGQLGLEFRGLHFYDGHLGGMPELERTRIAHAGYDSLLKLVAEIQRSRASFPELITAGTPAMPCSLS